MTKNHGEQSSENMLMGKKLYGFGDSILAGHYNGITSITIIADNNQMNLTNYAVNGATIRGNQGNAIIPQIENGSSEVPDYIVFDGLANDAYRDMTDDPNKLGTITTGYMETLDSNTFCGAFETICKMLLEKYMGAKIIYVAVHKLVARDLEAQQTLQDLAKQICKKWAIPVVDLYNESGLNTFIPAMKDAYSYDTLDCMTGGSGTHLNEEGYSKFYVPPIESKMKAL